MVTYSGWVKDDSLLFNHQTEHKKELCVNLRPLSLKGNLLSNQFGCLG